MNLNTLNQHFSSPSVILNNNSKNETINYLSSLPPPDYQPFNFKDFADSDVEKTILSISSSALGCDGIGRTMIIPILDIVTPIITHLLNFSINTGTFPQIWKDAYIIPLPKKGNPNSLSDYRPISILPSLSKVLERLVQQQLNSFLTTNSLFNSFQSGFRSGHSTTTALINVTDDIRRGMDNKQLTVMTLLDFSNAFNAVDFDILLSLLSSLNISPAVITWFHSYLRDRRQRIRIDDSNISTWCNVNSGVPQGGVLSPLLFAIFINSISTRISSSYHLFADDLQIYNQAKFENLENAINQTNRDLSAIVKWSKYYGIKLNPTKTQAIIIGSSSFVSRIDYSTLPSISIDGVDVPFSSVVKNLGVYFDQTLSWTCQIKEISRRIFAAGSMLRRLQKFLPIPTKIVLAQSLLLSILDYADASYIDLTEE